MTHPALDTVRARLAAAQLPEDVHAPLDREQMTAALKVLWGEDVQVIGPEYPGLSRPTLQRLTAERERFLTERLDCGHPRREEPSPAFHMTGYALFTGTAHDSQNRTCCLTCAEAREQRAFRDSVTGGEYTAYLSLDRRSLTTWSGGVLTACTVKDTPGRKSCTVTFRHPRSGRPVTGTARPGEVFTLRGSGQRRAA